VSSRTARATQRNPVLKKKRERERERKKEKRNSKGNGAHAFNPSTESGRSL
jgi:hypothetical protein